MHRPYLLLLLSICPVVLLHAQEIERDTTDRNWSFSLGGYYYYVPEDENSISFIGNADYKKLHLEARYNYEDQNTGSVFVGWNFSFGNKLTVDMTPMIGTVFGNTDGMAPGLELSATFKKFDYYSETEYVFDYTGIDNSFLYTWGEFAFSPIEPLRLGFTYQKTQLYETDLVVQKGFLAQYFIGMFTVGAYYFNPFTDDYLLVANVSIDF